MTIHIRGQKQVITNLNREIKKLKLRSNAGIFKAGLYLLAESKKQTPVVSGFLRNSGYIASDYKTKGASVYVGYHAIYAAKTHENPRTGKTEGKSPSGQKYPPNSWSAVGKWKFLEDPLKENVARLLSIIKSVARIK